MEWYLSLAFLLAGIGLVFLAAEFFIPSGGTLVVMALACFAVAVGLIFLYGEREEAIAAVIALSVGVPITGSILFYGWRRLSLKSALDSDVPDTTLASIPVIAELENLRGLVGQTVSPMRPSGVVEFEGRRIDAMSEGMMIQAKTWVKCIDIKAGRVIVREVELSRPVSDLELDPLN